MRIHRVDTPNAFEGFERATHELHDGIEVKQSPIGQALMRSRSTSLAEVVGFQFARALGLPVPKFAGFYWHKDSKVLVPWSEDEAEPFRVGILLDLESITTELELPQILKKLTEDQAARYLALSVFARRGWPRVGCDHAGQPVLFNLENMFTPVDAFKKFGDLTAQFNGKRMYGENRTQFDLVLNDATEVGLDAIFLDAFGKICLTPGRQRSDWVTIIGHPYERLLSDHYADLFRDRVDWLYGAAGVDNGDYMKAYEGRVELNSHRWTPSELEEFGEGGSKATL